MNYPTVAIIIPCRNEEKYIGRCITSIQELNYPQQKLYVYICDGMSDDGTRDVLKSYSKKESNIHLLENERKTTPFALNLGIKTSPADINIILGAHSEVDKDFVLENVKAFKQGNQIGCTGGVIKNVYEDSMAELIGLAMSSVFGVGNAHFRTGTKSGYVDTVAFGAYKREVFDKIGYFDEELARNQDDEFNYRLLKNGFKIYLSPAIQSKYYVRGSIKKLYKQYFQYGFWKVYVNKKHKAITTIRQLIPFLFVVFLILGSILSTLSSKILISFISVLLIYLITAFFFGYKLSKRITTSLKLMFLFFVLHISYGLGYLKGIVWFILFNKKPHLRHSNLSR
jgi:glycosyltransferase involved in cell wall biosynthesis